MKISLKNLYLGFKYQFEHVSLKNLFVNWFVTRNSWSLLHINSHISQTSGKPKVCYRSCESATKAANDMKKKTGNIFGVYKCFRCDDFHIGKNRSNK